MVSDSFKLSNSQESVDQGLTRRVKKAIEAVQRGEFVVILDDKERENEGDLVIAAEKITAQKINFMIREACGLVCISMDQEELSRLKLPQMVAKNEESKKTRFAISVDSKEVHTGISSHERALTIQQLVNPSYGPEDFVKPGHIFPIKVHPQGIFGRDGHTEASYELVKLAGLTPGAVICEIINPDGTMAREHDLIDFAKKHRFPFLKIAELIHYLNQERSDKIHP